MREVCRLVIAGRLDNVRQACDVVVEAAESVGLDERAVYHCQMAVDESLTNIIEHGYQHQGDGHDVELICSVDNQRFVITILDDSPAFNPLEHESPDPSEPLDSREPGGWGIYFIRRLMDDVQYNRVGDRNQLVLSKNLPSAAAAAAGEEAHEDFPVRTLDDDAVVVAPSGRLDSNTSPELEKVLNRQLEKGATWLFVDMSGVEYIASSGLKVLVSAWRRAQEKNGDVILSGLQPRLVEIFEMVGFDMLFSVYADLDAALATRS